MTVPVLVLAAGVVVLVGSAVALITAGPLSVLAASAGATMTGWGAAWAALEYQRKGRS